METVFADWLAYVNGPLNEVRVLPPAHLLLLPLLPVTLTSFLPRPYPSSDAFAPPLPFRFPTRFLGTLLTPSYLRAR